MPLSPFLCPPVVPLRRASLSPLSCLSLSLSLPLSSPLLHEVDPVYSEDESDDDNEEVK